jgi:hypothetical protein
MPTIFADSDKFRIVRELGLLRPGMYKVPTAERYEQDRLALTGWYEPTPMLDGAVFGKRWREYQIQYLGWDQGSTLPPDWYILNACFVDIRTPEKPDKPIMLVGVRVHYTLSEAFAEILFRGQRPDDRIEILKDPNGEEINLVSINTIDTIQNAEKCKTSGEITKVWRGFALFKNLLRPPGRKLGKTEWSREQFLDACKNHSEDFGNLSRLEQAEKLGIHPQTLDKYRRLWPDTLPKK